MEYRFRRKDGSYCWVNDEQHLIRGVDGKPSEIVGSWSDIAARKAAEEAKAAAHARLSQLLASSPAVIYSYKATGDFAPTFVSENISGVARLRAAGNTWKTRISGGAACIPTTSLRWRRKPPNCSGRATTRSSIGSSRRTAAIAG